VTAVGGCTVKLYINIDEVVAMMVNAPRAEDTVIELDAGRYYCSVARGYVRRGCVGVAGSAADSCCSHGG
jgi:hypothetical protein